MDVTCEQDSDNEKKCTLIIQVKDSGIGMTAKGMEKIFDPFVQLNADTAYQDNSLRGNGLGLAITRSLVESSSGSIQVSSELGKGSVFEIQLPIDVVDSTPELSINEVQQANDYKKYDILIVDDHAANRMVAAFTIQQALPNVIIDQARNGTEGFQKMSEKRYDLVLMDLIMPDISGVEVVRRVRSECSYEFSTTPVIALTANVAEDAVQACNEVGIFQVIPKPFDRKALINAILLHCKA
jgi:CheY-like chemotaxis protein